MQLKLFNFSKRRNSTKQPPTDYPATIVEVFLKNPTSVSEPTFIISGVNVISEAINYCLWEDRYYFVTDITYLNNDNCEIQCSIDVLATFKTQIHNMTAFVLYANTSNTEISDTRIPTKTTATYAINKSNFDVLGSGGYTIVINVTGTNSCASYAITETRANELLNAFISWYNSGDSYVPDYSGTVFQDIEEAIKALIDMIKGTARQTVATGTAGDAIKSAYAIPIPLSSFGGFNERIYLGNYDTGKNGQKITDRIFSDGCEIAIPWQSNDWRRNSPYHEIYVYIPYVGLVSVSPSDVMGFNSLHVSCNIDKCNGDAIFNIWAGDSKHIIGQYSTNIGSTYAIGSSNVTPLQSATSLAGSAGGVAALIAGATGAGAVAAATAAGLGLVNAINGSPTSISSNGGGATLGLNGQCSCFTVFHDTIVPPDNMKAVQGEPVSKVLALNTLTGYIQCVNASIELNAHSDERDKVNDFLNSGFYYE